NACKTFVSPMAVRPICCATKARVARWPECWKKPRLRSRSRCSRLTKERLAKPNPNSTRRGSVVRMRCSCTMLCGWSFLGGFFIGGGAVLLIRGFDGDSMIWVGGIACVSIFLPAIILWIISRGRKDNIFYGLPDALDLMVVCVEAGLGLDQAMRKVAEEMKNSYHIIAEEFSLCNLQLQMGRARNEVLHDLGARTGVDDLKALAAILIQADKFGSSVAQALRVQSDSMRTRRSQLAEEKAAKTAVKLIFPLVLFIFPAIFIVLVGPAAITMINELFPSMNGEL
ncbi:MAG: type II secretion system F family protein, partial [Planctomycetes bacterium]|nr:type II secretion system F family protein [Planctomycetota bacterium]